jgi:hypothetical protein
MAILGGLPAYHESRPAATITTIKVTIAAAHSVQPQIFDDSFVQLISLQRLPQGNILSETAEVTTRQKPISVVHTTSDSYCAQLNIYLQNLSARGKAS